MNKLIIISGPTASGKTKTSINLATYIQDVLKQKVAIVNFDSLLFYQEINIGTAKPTKAEQKNIHHELIDIVSITSPLNASDYINLALKKINELHSQNTVVILVGGSAFYLRALLKGMYEVNSTNDQNKQAIKEELEKEYKEFGIEPFIEFLSKNDPESLINLHANDHYRLTRAVEFFKLTGTKISEQKKKLDDQSPYDFTKITHDWDIVHFYLDLPKNTHQEIIESRTRLMLDDGLKAEVENILALGFSKSLKPLESIGYKEMIDFLDGKYPTIEDCFKRIIISTRQLAKSQRTFFKKIEPKITANPITDFDQILNLTIQFLKVD